MNETYEWLYDYYALPLMKVSKQADALKERIVSRGSPADALFLWDSWRICACCGARSPLPSGSNWACGSWRASGRTGC